MNTTTELPRAVQVILDGRSITFTPMRDGAVDFWNASIDGLVQQLPWRVLGDEQPAFFRALADEMSGSGG